MASKSMITRKIIAQDPFIAQNKQKPWRERGLWPSYWISCPAVGKAPSVVAYRLRFAIDKAGVQTVEIPIHVTADERYELFLDGKRIARGSERGDPNNWFYESYTLTLAPGAHLLVARVQILGSQRAMAQMSVQPGFLLCAEGEWQPQLSTGIAAWEAKKLGGYRFAKSPFAHWRGARIDLDGAAFPWGYEQDDAEGNGWQRAEKGEQGVGRVINWMWYQIHRLQPATLPAMLDEERRVGVVRHVAPIQTLEAMPTPVRTVDHLPHEQIQWQDLLMKQGEITIPPQSRRRILIDMEEYYCLYPELLISGGGGGTVHLHSAESLYLQPEQIESGIVGKGHRDEIEGKYFIGIGDTFRPDGGPRRTLETLWWQAGRYWELTVETADQALTIHRITLRETRYPLEMESHFSASDQRLESILPMLVRSMQAGSHETYYDAPHYEEMMYAGDTRLEILNTYMMSRDDRLPRKAIRLFDSSRLASGMTQARYPSWETQVIPPFALWWVLMMHDYAQWRDDLPFVRSFLPGMRATLEGFQREMDANGLLRAPEGWNFMDWLDPWEAGVPPQAFEGYSGLLNWQLVYVLTQAADLEAQVGDPDFARIWRHRARKLADNATAAFWDDARGLLAEDKKRQHFSEHTQCMALLSSMLEEPYRARVAHGLLNDPDLLRTTYYFSHYLFETYRLLERVDRLFARLEQWYVLPELGLKTTIEKPEPTRSDCHAWSAHPLFHYFATILGIRPGSPGFSAVEIRPQLGNLTWAEGRLVHPRGEIVAEFRAVGGDRHAAITLPEGITGTLYMNGHTYPLTPGANAIVES